MGCNTDCRPSFCGVAVFGAFVLAIVIGILFGFGILPLFDAGVYALIGIGAFFAALFVAAAGFSCRNRLCGCCFGRAARTWIIGAVGTVASALSVLAFVGIAPAWLAGVLVGLLTLFTALLLIAILCYAFCTADVLDCTDGDD